MPSNSRILIANVGDSRAVLCRAAAQGLFGWFFFEDLQIFWKIITKAMNVQEQETFRDGDDTMQVRKPACIHFASPKTISPLQGSQACKR